MACAIENPESKIENSLGFLLRLEEALVELHAE